MTAPLQPGLLVLHGNRLEWLAQAVFAWLREHPLAPLEPEQLLVQSNGMAEWLKMEIATAHGVCAAARLELPARFVWRAYRAVLGAAAVPALSPLDKQPLTWRLMQLLPALLQDPALAPVAGFLAGGDAARRLQLAQRLADLFDQYQVYRGDWLEDWARGDDRLRSAGGAVSSVPDGQRWQPVLWRALLAGLAPEVRAATRPALHRRFLAALQGGPSPAWRLPRRVVLFGSTHLPQQTLEAIAALAGQVQVLLAVPNPCRYHWADIIDGRELLQAARRRHPLRGGRDLAAVPLQDMHAHGHPLLAAWGRQSRDFVRQLDAFDDVQQAQSRFALPRVDLFDSGPGTTLLQQLQAQIRDLVPLAEQPRSPLADDDRSIVFHVAHSAQREVEILHDQLLRLLAAPPGGTPLQPRDIVVMVPDIEAFAPAIHSVFGQHERGHARHIPWGIADLRERGRQPLLVALEWLLRAPQQRFAFSELRDLLDVPAVARRLGLAAEDLPLLLDWARGAGVRWGLHAAQRQTLGLGAGGEANSWRFGLQRMLLGYASGALDDGFAGIEPHTEVAGLSAGLAGVLAELLQRLDTWWADAALPRPPAAWGQRLRTLLQDLFAAQDDGDRALLAALDEALADWLQACEAAGLDEALELAVVREAWLGAVDEPAAPGGARRFRAGGVTFCTLLPLRAIPFEVVCLLGMNDGDYPRRSPRSDFDLMALPGQARPGDRARRDDDRQLMLDALLSARRVLYLSWAGRSQRDNQAQPPSVLVAQLRDHIAAGWGEAAVAARSTEHPLQPFSRRYFEGRPALFSYAAEWRSAHATAAGTAPPAAVAAAAPSPLTLARLARFLRNPVQAFFRERLQVRFEADDDAVDDDDERFATAGLDRWQLLDTVLRDSSAALAGSEAAAVQATLQRQLARLQRAGRLPLAGPGRLVQQALQQTLAPMLQQWQDWSARHPQALERLALRIAGADGALLLDDTLPDLRAATPPLWIALQAGNLADADRAAPRGDKLLPAWLRCLAAAACGQPVRAVLIGADVLLQLEPLAPAPSLAQLQALLQAAQAGLCGDRPLPTALRTGLAWLADPAKAWTAYDGSGFGGPRGEGLEPCLARLYPDFAALAAAPGFEAATRQLYTGYADWLARGVTLQPLDGAADTGGADGA